MKSYSSLILDARISRVKEKKSEGHNRVCIGIRFPKAPTNAVEETQIMRYNTRTNAIGQAGSAQYWIENEENRNIEEVLVIHLLEKVYLCNTSFESKLLKMTRVPLL